MKLNKYFKKIRFLVNYFMDQDNFITRVELEHNLIINANDRKSRDLVLSYQNTGKGEYIEFIYQGVRYLFIGHDLSSSRAEIFGTHKNDFINKDIPVEEFWKIFHEFSESFF